MRDLQPNAVIFSDAGPDIRWVGNEKGYANQTTWSPILKDSLYPGMLNFNKFSAGQENGTHWIPTETDVSIRPGWYYHPEQDNQVKSVEKLIDIYYNSVGLNSALLLNIPVDTRGLIHEKDEQNLRLLYEYIENTFDEDLSKNQKYSAFSTRKGFDVGNIFDGNSDTFWVSPKHTLQNEIIIDFDSVTTFDVIEISEKIDYGQRIKSFEIEVLSKNEWKKVFEGTTIGNRRLVKLNQNIAKTIKIKFTDSKASPIISKISVYNSFK